MVRTARLPLLPGRLIRPYWRLEPMRSLSAIRNAISSSKSSEYSWYSIDEQTSAHKGSRYSNKER